MSGNKTLRGNIEIFFAYPEAFAVATAPTSTELENTDFVKVISCAINDDFTLNLKASDTDKSISVCDIATVETPTFTNYEAALNIFRDADITATGVFNLAFSLFKNAGIRGWLGVRIGLAQGTAFTAGDIISMFDVKTDNPTDIEGASSPMQLGAKFKPQGTALVEYELVA